MNQTSAQSKKLQLDRTTVALLNKPFIRHAQANYWINPAGQSTLPACDVTNTGTGSGIL